MPQFPWRAVAIAVAVAGCPTATPLAQAPPPAPLDGWFVADSTGEGVVVLIGDGGDLYVPIRELNASSTSTTRPVRRGPIIDMPAPLVASIVGDKAHVGDPWTIATVTEGSLQAVVDHFVLGYKNCGEAWGVYLRLEFRATDAGQWGLRSGGPVVARPGTFSAPARRSVGQIVRALSEPERGEMAMLLEQARRQTIGDVRHEWAERETQRLADPAMRAWDAKWTGLDKALDRQDARVTFDTTFLRATPDSDPRLFVQARWTVNGLMAYALTMWMRMHGSHLTIESIDAAPARLVREPEMATVTVDRVTSSVLGVFDVNGDGRAEVLVLRPGYESIDRDLIEYPATAGTAPRLLSHYGDGC